MTTHTQCRLMKGNVVQVTWLPSCYANKGKYVKLRRRIGSGCLEDHTEWDDGWLVAETYMTMDSSYVNERSRDHRNLPSLEKQRKKGKR